VTETKPPAPPLATYVVQVDGHAVLMVRGEIDPATAELFGSSIEAAFAQASRVVIDLREVEFMDSTGVRVLIQAFQRAGKNREALQLRAPSPFVQRVLTITGLDGLMTITPASSASSAP